MTRRDPPAHMVESLRHFYAGPFGPLRCVVTNEAAELHHLDDNDSNTVAENLVPISADLNKHLHAIRLEAQAGNPRLLLQAVVEPKYLAAHAATRFAVWDVGPAYGAARLACFVSSYQGADVFERARLGFQALYYVRTRREYAFILDTLNRDILPAIYADGPVPGDIVAQGLRDFAGMYSECGFLDEADALYDVLDRLPRPNDDDEWQASLVRRLATTTAARHGLSDRATALLREAEQILRSSTNIAASVANTKAWVLIQQGDFGKALDLLEPLVRDLEHAVFRPAKGIVPASMTPWNAAELFRNYSVALAGARPGNVSKRLRRANAHAADLYHRIGAKAFELRGGFSSAVEHVAADFGLQPYTPQISVWPNSLKESVDQASRRLVRLATGV